ncbi:MAG: periplasmic heavy metal sensor [Chitinivibrionales bacterium]|nr:periplasmic heavy metal sensor [Chitinivibrionales bacterium]
MRRQRRSHEAKPPIRPTSPENMSPRLQISPAAYPVSMCRSSMPLQWRTHMNNRLISIILVVLTVVNLAALGTFMFHRFRQPPPPCSMEPGLQHRRMHEMLGLSEEQHRRIRKVRSEFRNTTQPLRDSIHDYRMELLALLEKEGPDITAVDSLLDFISNLQNRMHKMSVHAMLQEKENLTPAQHKLFIDKFKCKFAPHSWRPGMHGPGRGRHKHRHKHRNNH